MSLLDAFTTEAAAFHATPVPNHSQTLRQTTAAVRVSFTWMGTRKSVTPDQRDDMAQAVGAEGDSIGASKKLLNTKHPAFRALTRVKGEITRHWQDSTLPWVEDGVRLLKQSKVEDFAAQMEAYRSDLALAVAALGDVYHEMQREARDRLGSLYNPGDYPYSLDGLFAVEWSFPSVEPPDYLLEINPRLYEQERQRIAAQFDQAVRLAEEAFTEQFAEVVGHLCDKLSGKTDDGKPMVFKDATVANVHDFLERFKSLNIGSSAQLDELVSRAQNAVNGVTTKGLKTNGELRATVAANLATVREQLDTMLIARPRRKIIRPTTTPSPETPE